jgi:hypothetical protein
MEGGSGVAEGNTYDTMERDGVETRGDRPHRLSAISDAAAAYRLVYSRVDALIPAVLKSPNWQCRPVLPGLSAKRLPI